MKTTYKKLLLLLLMLPVTLFAQNKLSGVVTDKANGQTMPGVNVAVKGTNYGVATDFSGAFTISNLKNGDVLTFKFLGYSEFVLNYVGQKTVNIAIQEESSKLNEVVVVGYGSVKKKDATGSVALIAAKDFNKGAIFSVDQLLTGKAAGVRITNNGGDPDSAPNIRIRGGGSVGIENSPLLVVDGVPLGNTNAAGNNNPLSLINPNDIESFTILKDASATAIYGSRASNGVIQITTKKGTSGKTEFNFSSSVSIGEIQKKISVKGGLEYTQFIQAKFPQYTNLLGIDDPTTAAVDNLATPQIEGRILSDTNWQDAIYQNSVSTDNNFSVRTNLFKKVPLRVSLGYTKNEGLVKTSGLKRFTPSIRLTPMLFDKHLKIDLNAKGLFSEKNAIDEGGVFGNALNADPTKPIFSSNTLNSVDGYYQGFNGLALDGFTNPLAVLEQRRRPENIRKVIGNIEFDYKFHFLPELRAVLNLGLEASKSKIEETYNDKSIQSYQKITGIYNPGVNYSENQTITNTLMDAYLVYNKEFTGIVKRFDVQGGYSYQNFKTDGNKVNYRYNNTSGLREEAIDPKNPNNRYFNPLNLQSFFGRSNIDVAGKYLFTLSFRADASSFFLKEKRWGYFPGAAFAWKINEENFLKDSKFISNLKLRLGWGKTGQQDITKITGNYFPSTALFVAGNQTSQYLPNTNSYTALPFDPNLTWEKSTTYNAGLDFDLFKNNIVMGSVDIYKREVTDILAKVSVAPGTALTNQFVKNTGKTEGKGVETSLSIKLVDKENFSLILNTNTAYNYNKIVDLGGDESIQAADAGLPISTGANIGFNAVGYQPNSFFVYEQIYGANGNPIEGAFVDRNKVDGITTADKYYKAVIPNWTFGFGLNASYKNFDFTSSFRGQKGGLVYNSKELIAGNVNHAAPGVVTALSNVLSGDLLFNNNINTIPFSDYFLQDASFIRCENITLGYKFNNVVKNGSLRIYVAGNNLFVASKYTGQDPENFNGIDNNFYPRPRLYTFGLNLNF
jgi:TonB-dependent starch-binding outer membrane protein SusC